VIPSQMLKGVLEGCILKIIEQQETYGYEISQKLNQYGFGDISEGTIYPLLLRLEKRGLIVVTYRDSNTGPKRKYFRLSDSGKDELRGFKANWMELSSAVNELIGGNDNE
jgi:PadR family transcriptional regulator PadR